MLKEKYEARSEPDEADTDQDQEDEDDFDTYDAGNEFMRESAASPPAPNNEGKNDNFTKDYPFANSKNPSHSSNGLDFGMYHCGLFVFAVLKLMPMYFYLSCIHCYVLAWNGCFYFTSFLFCLCVDVKYECRLYAHDQNA